MKATGAPGFERIQDNAPHLLHPPALRSPEPAERGERAKEGAIRGKNNHRVFGGQGRKKLFRFYR
jgi:hypothetical protein